MRMIGVNSGPYACHAMLKATMLTHVATCEKKRDFDIHAAKERTHSSQSNAGLK